MVEQTKYNSRQRLLATRSGLSPQWVAQANQSIGQHILQILQLKTVRCLAVYFPIRSEPDIINHYVKYTEYCQLALPVCTQSGKLSFLSWQPGQGLVSGSYNIPVPAHAEEIEPDALLLPCVGFNTMGYRLGYGGGGLIVH